MTQNTQLLTLFDELIALNRKESIIFYSKKALVPPGSIVTKTKLKNLNDLLVKTGRKYKVVAYDTTKVAIVPR